MRGGGVEATTSRKKSDDCGGGAGDGDGDGICRDAAVAEFGDDDYNNDC